MEKIKIQFDETICSRLTWEQKNELEKVVREQNSTKSEFIRKVLEKYLNTKK